MTLFRPCPAAAAGLTFVDLSAAPVNVLTHTYVAGTNTSANADYAALIAASALYGAFLVTIDKAAADLSDSSLLNLLAADLSSFLIIQPFTGVGAPFNCTGFIFCDFNTTGFVDATTMFTCDVNNLGAGQNVSVTIDCYGYFFI